VEYENKDSPASSSQFLATDEMTVIATAEEANKEHSRPWLSISKHL